MKDKFIEAFTDIDDELIKGAMPTAQKPIELKAEPSRFSWKKLTAAAACVAVLGGGGIAAVKMMNSPQNLNNPDISDSTISSGDSLSAADSGNSDSAYGSVSLNADTTPHFESSNDSADSSLPDVLAGLKPQAILEKVGDSFKYDGKSYGVIDVGGGGGMDRENNIIGGYEVVVGVRREMIDGVDTVEFAAYIENIGNVPEGLMSTASSPDKPVLFRFELNDESIDTRNVFDTNEFKYMAYVLQPGERYIQTASFPVTEAEYMFSYCISTTDPNHFDETKSYEYNKGGYITSNDWADFSDKSVSFDDVSELFGSSKLSKELAAAYSGRQ